MTKSNKFDDLKHSELVKLCLEQQDELLKLRPPPAKFRLGQVVAYTSKNPYLNGQLNLHFCILSVENRNGKWWYGYAKSTSVSASNGFQVWPEERLRSLTPTEIDGSVAPVVSTPISTAEGQGQALPNTVPPHGQEPIPGQQIHWAFVDEASL